MTHRIVILNHLCDLDSCFSPFNILDSLNTINSDISISTRRQPHQYRCSLQCKLNSHRGWIKLFESQIESQVQFVFFCALKSNSSLLLFSIQNKLKYTKVYWNNLQSSIVNVRSTFQQSFWLAGLFSLSFGHWKYSSHF